MLPGPGPQFMSNYLYLGPQSCNENMINQSKQISDPLIMSSKQLLGMIQASTISMKKKIHSQDSKEIEDNNSKDIEHHK
jgi:hypothetical protein